MTDDPAAFRARLSACRRSAGLSQEELAVRSGLSVRALGNLERGRTRWPYPKSVRRLADALELQGEAREEFLAAARRRPVPGPRTAIAVPEGKPGGPRGGEPVVPRQLPAAVRQFIGRQDELAALTGLLDQAGASRGVPAVVISAIGGMAGVGKTALAVHWAHRVTERFPDGQLYVNLHGFDSREPIAAADALAGFLRALGCAGPEIPESAEERAGAYRSRAAGRRMLVVLDNARRSEQVRLLLPGSPGCMTLVTSRDALAGLVAGDGAVRLEVDVLPIPEAVGLLRGLIGGRVDDDREAAEQLARQCGQLPLALRVAAELATGRPGAALADLTAELASLQHRLDALDTGGDERTTVRSVLSWSYRALGADAARLFRLAGLHPGPSFDQYAAAALTGTTLPRAGQLLNQLARAHLVQPAASGRYGLHDLVRSYARELATGDGADEDRAALARLFDYYLHAAGTAMNTAFPADRTRRPAIPPACTPAPALDSKEKALTWLAAERESLIAVAVHAAGYDQPGAATSLAAVLETYLETECLYPEAITIHSQARQAARSAGHPRAEASALNSLGVIDLRQGRYQQSADNFEQALTLFRVAGDQLGQARALGNLGFTGFLQGRTQQASDHLHQALTLFRSLGDKPGQARMHANLGHADLQQGRYQQAARHVRRSLALCREIRDQAGQGRALGMLGELDLRRRRYQQAATHLLRALALFRAIGDRTSEADALAWLGVTDLRQGRYRQAAGYLARARAVSEETGDLSSQANALNGLGELLLATEQPDVARARHAAALNLAVQAGETHQQARAHAGLAGACQASGDLATARLHYQHALTLYTDLGAPEADLIRSRLPDADNAAPGRPGTGPPAAPAIGGADPEPAPRPD
jgi:tetratricopeptide (TPR) repeat protein/transcriptional regulator with XRE-family HTH domain